MWSMYTNASERITMLSWQPNTLSQSPVKLGRAKRFSALESEKSATFKLLDTSDDDEEDVLPEMNEEQHAITDIDEDEEDYDDSNED